MCNEWVSITKDIPQINGGTIVEVRFEDGEVMTGYACNFDWEGWDDIDSWRVKQDQWM